MADIIPDAAATPPQDAPGAGTGEHHGPDVRRTTGDAELGRKLRALRRLDGRGLKESAHACGVSVSALSEYERAELKARKGEILDHLRPPGDLRRMPPKVDGVYVHGPECDCDWCEEDLQLMRTGRIRSEAQVQAEGQTPVRGRRGRVVNIRGPKKGGTGDARLARYYGVSADRLIRHLADDIPAA